MKLTWVNHASFILYHGDIKLISDPWIEGRVFNNSWELLAKSKFTFEDFEEITHIWFSHEHPDHFFPPNISKIPKKFRENITVIFQKTIDKRVIEFCHKMDFKEIVELADYQPYYLQEDFKLTIAKVRNDSDSWLSIEVDGKKLLNLNDCILEDEEINALVNYIGEVDVLFTQFSFANWAGNVGETEKIKQQATDKFNEMKRYIHAFKPKFTIPFASYVWFCHQDNFYFNAFANRIDDVYAVLKKSDTIPLVLYPGDQWELCDANHNSLRAISSYMEDLTQIQQRELTISATISEENLQKATTAFVNNALSKNNKLKLRSYKPFRVYITDLCLGAEISYKQAYQKNETITLMNADISMHSQCLNFCLVNEYGFDTILVAGTYQVPDGGNFQNFMEYRWVASLNNHGKRMNGFLVRLIDRLIAKF